MKYDGEVLIHAGITTDDISKDVKEVSGELGGLGKVLQKLGFKISNAMSKPVTGTVKQIKKDIDDCAKALEKYQAQLYKAQDDKKPFDRQAASMDAERDAARWRLEQLKAQQKAAQKALELPEGRMATASELDAYMDAQARLPQINEDLAQQQAKVDALEKKWKSVCDKIDKYELKINQAKQLIADNEQKAAELADELKEAEEASRGLHENSKPISKDMDKMSKKVSAFGSRLKSIVMGAFIFNGISAGLRELTSYFGSVLKTNQAFTAELSKLKGALLTAFQPIYNAVAPALTQLIRLLTSAVLAVAQFFAAISGTSLEANAEAAKGLYEQANALDSVGGAAKKASKAMAGFDEINTLQDSNASGGGAGSSGATAPDFSLGDWSSASGNLTETIKIIVSTLSGLSLGKFIADLMTANIKAETLKDAISLLGKKTKITLGVTLAIVGLTLEIDGIIGAITDGLGQIDFSNILLGTSGLTAGGAMIGSFFGSSILGGAIGGILGGIPAFITGIYDAIVNGINWLNGILIPVGSTAAGTAIGAIIGVATGAVVGPWGALIGLIVGLVTDLIILLIQNWDEFWAWMGQFLWNSLTQIGDFFYGIWLGLENFGTQFIGFWTGLGLWLYDNVILPIGSFFTGLWNGLVEGAVGAWEGIMWVFSSVGGFFTGVFNTVKDAILGVFSKGGEIFVGIGEGILSVFKTVVNALITGVNFVISKPFEGLNGILGTIQGIDIVGLKPFGWLSWRAPVPQIPYLAQGAVLPPNKPFMAVVGDQRHGTNVEAPLATIQEAVALVMADQMGGMMAGFNAVTERQERILQAIFGLDISDGALAAAVQRHQDKMSTVTGGIA